MYATVDKVQRQFKVYDSYMFRFCIKEIGNAIWDGKEKIWRLPYNKYVLNELSILGCTFPNFFDKYIEKTEISVPEPKQPLPLKAKPYSYQTDGYALACDMMGIFPDSEKKTPGYGLEFEMGCGKTLTSIAVLGRAYLNGLVEKALILAPKSILGVWTEELNKFADFAVKSVVIDGKNKAEKLKKLDELSNYKDCLKVAIINYESMYRLEDELLEWNPNFLICDESTKIKSPDGKASIAASHIAAVADYRMILTGTPVQNNPLDLFGQYRVISPEVFGYDYDKFRDKYSVQEWCGTHYRTSAWLNMKELIDKAHSVAYRVTKDDALDLPEETDVAIPIQLEKDAIKAYESVLEGELKLSKSNTVSIKSILTKFLRLQQITGGFIKGDKAAKYINVSNSKLDTLEELVETLISQNQKVVIMAKFTAEIDAICKMLKKKKIETAVITGKTKDRDAERIKFQTNPDCKVFVGQIQATSMGITLTAASTMIFYSLTFNYADYIQAKARIHRIGQTNKCTYIHLLAKNTIDEYILNALKNKKDLANAVVETLKTKKDNELKWLNATNLEQVAI